MLSDTQGQGCTASSTGRLSCSVPAIVCSTEMCPWQRPMRPEGKGTVLVDSDLWLCKKHLASCREATASGIRRLTETQKRK